MILKTQNTASGLNGIEHSSQHSPNLGFSDSPAQSAFDLTREVSERYEIFGLVRPVSQHSCGPESG
jgi:hypothetical protein